MKKDNSNNMVGNPTENIVEKKEISDNNLKKSSDEDTITEKKKDDFDPFEYDNLEEAPKEFIEKIIYADLSKLKKASGGILGEFCEKYAPKYKLQKGKSLKKKYEFIIAAEIIRHEKHFTTPGSVGSTMRSDKLKYRKSSNIPSF